MILFAIAAKPLKNRHVVSVWLIVDHLMMNAAQGQYIFRHLITNIPIVQMVNINNPSP